MATPTIKEIRANAERMIDLLDEARLCPWRVREVIRMIVDRLEALEKQNGEDHG